MFAASNGKLKHPDRFGVFLFAWSPARRPSNKSLMAVKAAGLEQLRRAKVEFT